MSIDPKQLARILVDQLEGKSEKETTRIVKAFVQLLAEVKMLPQWRHIERAIHAIWKEKYGVSEVKIVTAHALTKEALAELEKSSHGAGLSHRTDERLIGGAVVRIDDTRIDGSISGTLRRMKQTLQRTTYAK